MTAARMKIARESVSAIHELSYKVHLQVMEEFKLGARDLSGRSRRDRPGDVSEKERPHLIDWLDNPDRMVAQPTVAGGRITGGWGVLRHMDALTPAWQQHGPTQGRLYGGRPLGGGALGLAMSVGGARTTRFHRDIPLWRIINDGRAGGVPISPRFPGHKGGTEWLMWADEKGRTFRSVKLSGPIMQGPMKPRNFVQKGIYRGLIHAASSRGGSDPKMAFAQWVAKNVFPHTWRIAVGSN